MGRSFRLLLAVSILHLPTTAAEDQKVQEAEYRLAREAANFWHTAPGFVARETIHQRVLVVHRKRSGALDPKHPPEFKSQEITSWYALSSFRGTPEAVREFRRIFEIDGHSVQTEAMARTDFVLDLTHGDDQSRQKLLNEFEKKTLAGAATDFGQVLLLFTKSNLDKYAFEMTGRSRVGADAALVISFNQVAGKQSLHIVDGSRKVAHKLHGEVLVRENDYLPLRVNLSAARQQSKLHVRDEASVDYLVSQGTLLPASLTYRRFVDDGLTVESTYRYSGWQPLK